MAPRLSGQNCKFSMFLLSLNSQKRLGYKESNTKYRSLTWKPRRSHVTILIYRTWPINLEGEMTNSYLEFSFLLRRKTFLPEQTKTCVAFDDPVIVSNVSDQLCETPGGYSQKSWMGVCYPLPKTLNLFMTKICDFPLPYLWPKSAIFPYPIYDQNLRFSPTLFMTKICDFPLPYLWPKSAIFATLFMTKICDFCYPIYDLTKNSAPYLWPLRLAKLA